MKKLTATILAPVLALFLGSTASAAETAQAKRVDINTASEKQLEETLGVGAEDARRIVAARPYAKKEDLKARDVVPAATYEQIKKLIDSIC